MIRVIKSTPMPKLFFTDQNGIITRIVVAVYQASSDTLVAPLNLA